MCVSHNEGMSLSVKIRRASSLDQEAGLAADEQAIDGLEDVAPVSGDVHLRVEVIEARIAPVPPEYPNADAISTHRIETEYAYDFPHATNSFLERLTDLESLSIWIIDSTIDSSNINDLFDKNIKEINGDSPSSRTET